MDSFTFRGRDIAEFGAVAAFGESMREGAKISRSEYEMPGGGTVIIGGETYKPTMRTVTITPADGVEGTVAWRRAIMAWLQGGRGEMIVHHDPQVYRIAQFDTDGTYGWRSWPLGELQLTMTLQPFAYEQRMTTARASTQSGEAVLALGMPTEIPAPIEAIITPTGDAMTACTIECGGETVELAGMSIPAGSSLVYRAGDNHDEMAAVYEGETLTFEHVTRWAQLCACGQSLIRVGVTGGEAEIVLRARGRYPA